MQQTRLKVGILLDDKRCSAWARAILEHVLQSDYAPCCVVVLPRGYANREPASASLTAPALALDIDRNYQMAAAIAAA